MCSRVVRRLHDAAVRCDWVEMCEIYALEVVSEDRRVGERGRLVGREANVDALQADAGLGAQHVDRRVVATRGESLALVESRFIGATADDVVAELEAFTVYEIDTTERIAVAVVFDINDVAAAFDELEERFAFREGSAAADVIRSYGRIMHACNAQAWPDLRAHLADDCVVVDHRPVSLGQIGPDEWVKSLRVSADLSPGKRGDSKVYHAWDTDRAVIEFRFLVGLDEAAFFEQRHHAVIRGRHGRIDRVEFYPLEQLENALARFEELSRIER